MGKVKSFKCQYCCVLGYSVSKPLRGMWKYQRAFITSVLTDHYQREWVLRYKPFFSAIDYEPFIDTTNYHVKQKWEILAHQLRVMGTRIRVVLRD